MTESDLHSSVFILCPLHSFFKLYHEATIVNLLELLLYHQESIAQLEDYMIDLVDYCFRKFTFLNVWYARQIRERERSRKIIVP